MRRASRASNMIPSMAAARLGERPRESPAPDALQWIPLAELVLLQSTPPQLAAVLARRAVDPASSVGSYPAEANAWTSKGLKGEMLE